MRDRSETIYADSEEEYKEMMEQLNQRNSKRKRRKQSLGIEESEDLEFNKELEDSFKTYKPTIEERERADESKLLETINTMNENYKEYCNKNKNRSLSFSSKENEDPNQEEDEYSCLKDNNAESDFKRGNKRSMSYSAGNQNFEEASQLGAVNSFESLVSLDITKNLSTGPNTLSFETNNIPNVEAFVSQNLINFDDILKLIVIGDKGCGKSLFINQFISESNANGDESKFSKYTPTESLEIRKTFRQIHDKTIKIELWDTNLSVLNSQIIKTYYKISNGFILIADYDKVESFCFLEKQIENIFNFSNFHNNILFIVNEKSKSKHLSEKDSLEQKELVESRIKVIQDKYNISPVFIDLSKLKKDNETVKNFLRKIYLKKSKKTTHVKKPLTRNEKTPVRKKRTSNSNGNTNANSPLNNREQTVNITQKRTHSVKRNLAEMLNKLKSIADDDL